MSDIECLRAEVRRKDDVIIHLDCEVDRLDKKIATVLEWCRGNIESGSQVTPFCIQVRDLLEG